MPFVDLSHTITAGMDTYPGLPGPEITDHMSFEESAGRYATGTEFAIGRIAMVANTGTYLDTPAHRYRDGDDLSRLPLEHCAGLPAVVVTIVEGATEIGPASLPDDVRGCAVLLHSGWDEHWGTERYGDPVHPHLTEDGARHLVERGARLVGIDSVNIDDTVGGHRPAHTVLLGAGIPVVEHLRPQSAADHGRRLHRRAAGGAWDGDLPGPGVRDDARSLTGPVQSKGRTRSTGRPRTSARTRLRRATWLAAARGLGRIPWGVSPRAASRPRRPAPCRDPPASGPPGRTRRGAG